MAFCKIFWLEKTFSIIYLEVKSTQMQLFKKLIKKNVEMAAQCPFDASLDGTKKTDVKNNKNV